MKFNVTEVEFDFDLDYAKLTFDEEIEVRDLALGVWDADDEDDLIEEVTEASGFCIKSIFCRTSNQSTSKKHLPVLCNQ